MKLFSTWIVIRANYKQQLLLITFQTFMCKDVIFTSTELFWSWEMIVWQQSIMKIQMNVTVLLNEDDDDDKHKERHTQLSTMFI